MTPRSLAHALASARREVRCLDITDIAVADVEEAYRIQSELAALAHGDVRGWKVTALTATDQAKFSSARPVAGALLGDHVHRGPATLALANFVAPLLECEVAFVLGEDLPPRDRPYAREEIARAVAHVVAVFEIADGRVPEHAPDLYKLADCMNNGALITGKPVDPIDVANIEITLRHVGEVLQRGTSARILSDPLKAVVALANAQPLPAGGLLKGQIVTTGTCTTPVKLRKGDYVADFGPLGTLEMTIV